MDVGGAARFVCSHVGMAVLVLARLQRRVSASPRVVVRVLALCRRQLPLYILRRCSGVQACCFSEAAPVPAPPPPPPLHTRQSVEACGEASVGLLAR